MHPKTINLNPEKFGIIVLRVMLASGFPSSGFKLSI